MLTKRTIIIKIIYLIIIMLPYFLILGPFPFFRNLALVFFGFYFLLNIIVYFINRDINWLMIILARFGQQFL